MEQTKSTVYRVGNDARPIYFALPSPPTTYDELRKLNKDKVYNQASFKNGKNACSMFAPIHAIANNYSIDFSEDEIADIISTAIPKGYSPAWGWYMDTGVQHVIDWCKLNKAIRLEKVRIGWEEFRKFAALGWLVVTGYQGREGFWTDRFDKEIGDDDIAWGAVKYGHLICIMNKLHYVLLSRMYYLDNYGPDYKYKETKINHRGLSKLVANSVMFPSGYYLREE